MINLLPYSHKEEIKKQKNLKIIIHWEIFILEFIIIFLLINLIAFIYFSSLLQKEKILLSELEKKAKIVQVNELERKIKEFNLLFPQIVTSFSKPFDYVEILKIISEKRPEGIYFKSLSVKGNEFFLNGFAVKRENLLDFKKNLEKLDFVKNIKFPPSNLLKEKEIDFTISFTLEK